MCVANNFAFILALVGKFSSFIYYPARVASCTCIIRSHKVGVRRRPYKTFLPGLERGSKFILPHFRSTLNLEKSKSK